MEWNFCSSEMLSSGEIYYLRLMKALLRLFCYELIKIQCFCFERQINMNFTRDEPEKWWE